VNGVVVVELDVVELETGPTMLDELTGGMIDEG